MYVYRLLRKKYPIQLSGKGAAAFGNRWNSKGTEIVYAAESRALAMAEVVVHLSLETLPNDFVMAEIEIPKSIKVISLDFEDLPYGWNSFPHLLDTQKIGDKFISQQQSCVLKVPSAVVPGDCNYLINPHHSDFSLISIIDQRDFPFDPRVFN